MRTPDASARTGYDARRYTERRAAVRYPCPMEVSYQPCSLRDNDVWWQAEVWDISSDGIGLIVDRSIEPGTNLEMGLPPLNSIGVLVIYSTRQVDGSWYLGCTFLDKLRDDQVQAVLRSAQLRWPAPSHSLTPGS